MRLKRIFLLIVELIIITAVFSACQSSPADLQATVDAQVTQAVSETATAVLPVETVAAPSPTSAAVLPPAETAVAPPVEDEATPATRSSTRRELLTRLNAVQTAVNKQIEALQTLLVDPQYADEAWQDSLATVVDAIHISYAGLQEMTVPPQGTQPYQRTLDAVDMCVQAASLAEEMAAQAADERLDIVEEALGNCNNELVSLGNAFAGSGSVAELTPAPTFEARGCAGATVGFTPLIDLGSGVYQGFAGGLYPDGSNAPPPEHQAAGEALAAQIAPIDGKIVMLSIGMSNTRQEFNAFIDLAQQDQSLNRDLILVNGAISGRPAQTIDESTDQYWELVEKRLARFDVIPEQVQVVWLKQAHAYPGRPFPEDARTFQAELADIVQIISQRYPNVKMIYLSSRIYAGYASANLHPEPYAYQSGFSVKWLIEDYLDGKLPSDTPWLAWGPYLWADGTMPRSDGLTWECDELMGDGTHPSETGRTKVADLLMEFFKNDSTTQPWFLGNGS